MLGKGGISVLQTAIFVNGLIFGGYKLSWRVQSTNSSTHKLAILCRNYERKYYGHKYEQTGENQEFEKNNASPKNKIFSNISYFMAVQMK